MKILDDVSEKFQSFKGVQIIEYLKEMFKNKRKKFKLQISLTIILSLYLTGVLAQFPLMVNREIESIFFDPISTLYVYFRYLKYTFVVSIIVFFFISYVIMYVARLFVKEYDYDEETDTKVARNDGTFGTAHWMTEEEKQEAMIMSTDVKDINECILGIDKDKRIYARKQVMFTNGNVLIIGPPGSGKSVCIVNNDILQFIKMGDSFGVIDTKGKVYADTAYVAEKAGYDIKVFNIKPDEVEHSDACDLLSAISKDPIKAKSQANSITNTFMSNISDERAKKDIWYNGAYNLLNSMILIVKFDNSIPEEERTFGKVYDVLIEHSNYMELLQEYDYVSLNKKHPAYDSWMTFKGTRDVVKESVLGGLITSLNFMANDYVKQIVSKPEINFKSPGFKKCAYYIIIDDEDRSNNILATLFIESLFLQLKNAADSQKGGKELALPVSVHVEIDEAKQVGKLPMFTEKLSSVRSRGINIRTIFQDLSQIQQLYPNEEWRTVIADCTTTILLKIGEQKTAEYYEKEMGTYTYIMDNKRWRDNVGDPIHVHPDYQSTQGKGERSLMTAGELKGQGKRGLKKTELLVLIDGEAPLKLNKFMWWEHPFYKALNLQLDSRRRYAKDHIPKWYQSFHEQYCQEEMQMQAIQNTMQPVPGTKGMHKVDLTAMDIIGGKKGEFKKKNKLQ